MAVLTVDAVAQMDAAKAEVNSMGDAVRGLGSDAAAAGDQARTASSDFTGLADGSDNVASKSSQAAGAMGDLAGGLEAIGATGAATALEGVALGSQVAAGAGDALNLVSETAVGRFVLQTAASVAHRTATIAGSIATGAMTAAQTALNVVMAANPVLLVVIAIAALTAGVILAYKHSETFREIVQAVFQAASTYVGLYVDAIQVVVDLFRGLPGAARAAWDAVSRAVTDAIDDAGRVIDNLVTGARDAAGTVAGFFVDMFSPILDAIGWVQDLIDKIKDIDFPDIDFNPLDRSAFPTGPRPEPAPVDPFAPSNRFVKFELHAAEQDKDAAMRNLVESMREYFARQGQVLSVTEAPA